MVSLQDFCVGISPDDMGKLFQRYYRANMEHTTEGIGLGLNITKLLMEAHGGRIWVESAVGRGSIFFFTLPVAGTGREPPDWFST